MAELLWTRPEGDPAGTLLLGHGAGAPMDSEWMTRAADALARHGVAVARFEFAYMAARREGARKPPPRAERVLDEQRAAIAQVAGEASGPLLIGGKSYGGRVASMVAQEQADVVAGLVCLGYPFHPPGSPERLRTAHLLELTVPTLICQGVRDPFGGQDEVAGYGLPSAVTVEFFDGEHDLKPRKDSPVTLADNLERMAELVRGMIR